MNKIIGALAALIGLSPSGEGEQGKVMYVIAWARGVVWSLALISAVVALIAGVQWLWMVLAPRLIGA